ncbi:hypothetical protein [Actinacidiphila alni]|uniref:hypothetical protein n=1 Tax=Actinacidiphila alni TaxID=380248 RepID=UPI003455991D
MYLVHLHLRRADGSPPARLTALIGAGVRGAARAGDGVEHVAVHADALPHPVLGVYVVADRVEEAEAGAARAWRRALAAHPELTGWVLVEARTPLDVSFYERLLDAPAAPEAGGAD